MASNPTIAITQAVNPVYAPMSPVALSGVAGDDDGIVSITWVNSLGGSGSASFSGNVAEGYAWDASVPLFGGNNLITMTAIDTGSFTGQATINIVYPQSSSIEKFPRGVMRGAFRS